MVVPLKNYFNEDLIHRIGVAFQKKIPQLDVQEFKTEILDKEWPQLELKQRMRHISVKIRPFLSEDYSASLEELIGAMNYLKELGLSQYGFELMAFPDYVEVYGIDELEHSLNAIEIITQTTSCEFAIRPFILKYPETTIARMHEWSMHEHHMVRRLSSEGCRPRLPWAMALSPLKLDPSPILPILERLKSDPSETVRRSVANNLNDISKDNPQLVIGMAKKWYGKSDDVNKVVKHACRSLLKQGESKVMELFGFGSIKDIDIINFKILTPLVELGNHLIFTFDLKNESSNSIKLRLEYAIYFRKANGSNAKKVFSISEKEYDPLSTSTIKRNQPFKLISTRKLYAGFHQVSLIINGIEGKKYDFELIA